MLGSGNTAPVVWVASVSTGALISTDSTFFGVVPGVNNDFYPRVISGGDRAFIVVYDYTSTVGTLLCVGKYSPTALVGVAQTAAAADVTVRLSTNAGSYKTTLTPGSAGKAVDHSTNTIVGQKGTIMPYGVTSKG